MCGYSWGKSMYLFTHVCLPHFVSRLVCAWSVRVTQVDARDRKPGKVHRAKATSYHVLVQGHLPGLVKSQAAQLAGVNQPEWTQLSRA